MPPHNIGVKTLTPQSLVIISYRVIKPKKMPFYVTNNFCPECFLSSLWMDEFTIPRKMSLKPQRHTAHFSCYCFIVTIHLWISSVNFQFSGFFLLPSSHRPPRFFLWCCIMPLPSHGLQNTFQLCCVSKPQTKGKQNLVLTIQLNSALLNAFRLSQREVAHFGLLAEDSQLQMSSNTNTQQLPQKRRIWNY